jgi:hypothetical protein
MAKVLENKRGFPDAGYIIMAIAGKTGLCLFRGQPSRAAPESGEKFLFR